MIAVIIAGLVMVFWGAFPVLAEFYKYRDANGVLRFTDNLEEVPIEQREKIQMYQERTDFLTPEQIEENARRAAEKKAVEEANKQEAEKRDTAVELNAMKAEIEKERAELAKERKALEDMRGKLSTPDARKAYNDSAAEYNSRITAFEEKLEVFNRKVNEYNATLIQ